MKSCNYLVCPLKKNHVQTYFVILENIAYKGLAVDFMLYVGAPRVRYASLQELVYLCVSVLDAYNRKIEEVLGDVWDERKSKGWSGYDRLMLGIFCFDEVILSTVEQIHLTTKKRGAIFACVVHREICKVLNEANRSYIHSTEAPDKDELVRQLHRVVTDAVLMGAKRSDDVCDAPKLFQMHGHPRACLADVSQTRTAGVYCSAVYETA